MLTPALLLACCAAPPVPAVDFCLRDGLNRTHRLSDFGDRPVVVVFVTVDCPLAKLYAPRLVELAGHYGHRVGVVAIAAGRDDLGRYVRQHAIPFPVVADVGHIAADRFAAERSPEAFVVARGRVRYRGRIDDQYAVGVHRPQATRHELRDALDAVLAGRAVEVARTEAPGCPLGRSKQTITSADVSYSRDVAPILQKRCQSCHRPGQVGPFALLTYRDAADWAQAIREVVADRRMPPWGAAPAHGTFANDPSLTAAERSLLFRWIDAGCPEGDPRDLPPPVAINDGWTIPTPDVVLEMPQSFTLPAEGVIEYQCFRVDPGFREDRWVRAAEIVPGNRAVVHHCNIFLQPPGVADTDDLRPTGTLGSYCLTMAAQGTPPLVLGDGLAKRVPAGWKIVFVMHYQAIGSVQQDRTKLGLTFADPKRVKKEVATKLMYDSDVRIPPGDANHRVTQTWGVNRDVVLYSLFPHMHLRGKSFRYELLHPDGRAEVLLDVPRFDFGWQHRYELAEPRRIAAGSGIRCTAVYDNSAGNPANPDPTAEVRTGTQSWEEMFNGYFDVALADDGPEPWRLPPGVALLACVAGGVYLGRGRIARAVDAWTASAG